MLVLSRKAGESIMIGDGIEVRIVESNSRGVKVGIEAPRDIVVHRKEVYDAIKDENLQAIPQSNIVSLIEYFNKLKK